MGVYDGLSLWLAEMPDNVLDDGGSCRVHRSLPWFHPSLNHQLKVKPNSATRLHIAPVGVIWPQLLVMMSTPISNAMTGGLSYMSQFGIGMVI